MPNPLSQAPLSTSQDGVVITSLGPDTQIPGYYLLVIDLIYTSYTYYFCHYWPLRLVVY
jgi:hypothetical protein